MLFWKKMVKKFDAFSPLIPPRYFRVQYRHLFLMALRLSGLHFGNDSNLLIVFYVQIMPDDFVMQLHRF